MTVGASSSAINSTQDFLARMGGGRLFGVGASAVKYGNRFNNVVMFSKRRKRGIIPMNNEIMLKLIECRMCVGVGGAGGGNTLNMCTHRM